MSIPQITISDEKVEEVASNLQISYARSMALARFINKVIAQEITADNTSKIRKGVYLVGWEDSPFVRIGSSGDVQSLIDKCQRWCPYTLIHEGHIDSYSSPSIARKLKEVLLPFQHSPGWYSRKEACDAFCLVDDVIKLVVGEYNDFQTNNAA